MCDLELFSKVRSHLVQHVHTMKLKFRTESCIPSYLKPLRKYVAMFTKRISKQDQLFNHTEFQNFILVGNPYYKRPISAIRRKWFGSRDYYFTSVFTKEDTSQILTMNCSSYLNTPQVLLGSTEQSIRNRTCIVRL